MRTLLYTWLARLRGFARHARADAEFDQELESHLAMAVEEKVRQGIDPGEARRQARVELGGMTQVREEARAVRGLPWLDTLLLDARLGVRMLRRSWGLTLVGGMAMAITIGLGASILTIWNAFAGTRLPLDEGDRVVAIQPFDRASQRVDTLTPLADFQHWQQTLTSVQLVSAMRPLTVDIVSQDHAGRTVSAAELTASAFQVARVPPLIGRTLIDQDARAGAEPVAVIGFDLWRSAFASDPSIVGQRIQVAGIPRTIVGVMPQGFRFPVNQRLWLPLSSDGGRDERGSDVFVFARLAPRATIDSAQREVTALGLLSRETPERAPTQPEPRVVPYAAGFLPDVHANAWASSVLFLVAALLLVPPCANIAILVYARTVTKRNEFATRTALGASRHRIVVQLFVEILVLAAGAGLAGFLLARQFNGAGRIAGIIMPMAQPENLPFWLDLTPSLPTALRVGGLCVIAAAIAGALPALSVTDPRRRALVSGSGARASVAGLGRTWVLLLAIQIAVALAIVPSASEVLWGILRPTVLGPSLPLEQYVTASLRMDDDATRFESLRRETVSRLAGEPGISGATVSSAALMGEPGSDILLLSNPGGLESARYNVVDGDFFATFGARLLAGRTFEGADFQPGSTSVIVNRSFVVEVTGKNPLGERIRYKDPQAPAGTFDVVGVVEDIPGSNDGPMMFHPLAAAAPGAVVTVRSSAGAAAAAGRLRAVVAQLDPRLQLGPVQALEELYWQRQSPATTFGVIVGALLVIVVLFSIAGIYTLMTFVVAQRWHEIGVRAALGAQPRRLLVGIFGRAATPLLIGGGAGCPLAVALNHLLPIDEIGGARIPGVIPLSAALMIACGLLAVSGPARRAIRIDPTEALRIT